ncbi:MAG: hypothetical protein AAFO70_06725, partial [Pseudomonadota bacterium]
MSRSHLKIKRNGPQAAPQNTNTETMEILMFKPIALTTALVLAASAGVAQAGMKTSAELTEKKVTELKKAWGEGIVKIGSIYTEGGDYRAAAQDHIAKFYAFGESDVLFKPTLASAD